MNAGFNDSHNLGEFHLLVGFNHILLVLYTSLEVGSCPARLGDPFTLGHCMPHRLALST